MAVLGSRGIWVPSCWRAKAEAAKGSSPVVNLMLMSMRERERKVVREL